MLHSRGYWRPRFRVPSLRRIAFIGDSNTYGAGVGADETLPFNAERYMNEMCPGWPVEAPNFGVPGYNLWNSWIAFSRCPPVYDGVVLMLCPNDADMFGRTYHLDYDGRSEPRFDPAGAVGAEVTRCFDRIAAYRVQEQTPVAVQFVNIWDSPAQQRIAARLRDLCAQRDLVFIDSLQAFAERGLDGKALWVSELDAHPSAMAHAMMARQVATTLRRQGWFGQYDTADLVNAPDRVLEAAKGLIALDDYPPEAALAWAGRALGAKATVARRTASASGKDRDIGDAFDRAQQLLDGAAQRRLLAQRLRAISLDQAMGAALLPGMIATVEEACLRLDEVHFVLAPERRPELDELLAGVAAASEPATDGWQAAASAFFEHWFAELSGVEQILGRAGRTLAPEPGEWQREADCAAVELSMLWRTVACARECGEALRACFQRLQTVLEAQAGDPPNPCIAHASRLIAGTLRQGTLALEGVARRFAAIRRAGTAPAVPHTTIDVVVRCQPYYSKKPPQLLIRADYAVPDRFPAIATTMFRADGVTTSLRFRLPPIYTGRLVVSVPVAPYPGRAAAPFEIEKVRVFNQPNDAREFPGASLSRNEAGAVATPVFHLT
jgi:hypothetical protein